MNSNTAIISGDGNSGSQIGCNYGPIFNNFHGNSKTNDSNLQQRPRIISRRILRPIKHFVDRDAIASQIRDQLSPHEILQPLGCRIVVLYGLGGTGKSQLALQYANNHQTEYSILFWISAESQQSIENDFIALYRMMPGNSDIGNDELPEIEDLIGKVHRWIDQHPGEHLLVFDAADDLGGRACDPDLSICKYMPKGRQTDIILTTRNGAAENLATRSAINVDRMTKAESVELFCKNANSLTRLKGADVEEIVGKLGHWALAVTLAGNYVSRCPRLWWNPKRYLEEHERERRRLLEESPYKSVDQFTVGILTAYEISFKAMQSDSEWAARLLSLLACLRFENFSPDMLFPHSTEAASICRRGYSGRKLWQQLISSGTDLQMRDVEDMFRLLEDYSLIQRIQRQGCSPNTSSLSCAGPEIYQMHNLVRAWTYERLSKDERLDYDFAVSQLLDEQTLRPGDDPTARLRLIDHIVASMEISRTLVLAVPKFMVKIVAYVTKILIFLAFPAAATTARFSFSEAASSIGSGSYIDYVRPVSPSLIHGTPRSYPHVARFVTRLVSETRAPTGRQSSRYLVDNASALRNS